jgi:hypothetical protein
MTTERKIRIKIPRQFARMLQRNPKGNGNMYVVLILALVTILAAVLTRGFSPRYISELPAPNPADQVQIVTPTTIDNSQHDSLQLKTLKFQQCSQMSNVIVLVDNSGSMAFGNKLAELKSALTTLTERLLPNSLFGLYRYSSDLVIPDAQKEVIPIGIYPDVKTAAANGIASLNANGATWTRTAFSYMLPKLQSAQQQYADRPISFIFFSDGIPEKDHSSCGEPPGSLAAYACIVGVSQRRCFDRNEDPTDVLFGPDVAAQIRNIPITVYSIALKDQQDTCYNTDMQNMMLRIAGDSSRFFSVDDPARLPEFFTKVISQICGSQRN